MLPELLIPGSLPDFKADSYVFTPDPLYASVERHSGEERTRRLFTSAPGSVEASVEVSQEQLEEFVAWFEGPLAGGSVPFTAKLANTGLGFSWCKAFCLSYSTEHREGTSHLVSLQLRLIGDRYAEEPLAGSLYSEVACPLYLYPAEEGTDATLRSESSVALVITVLDGEVMYSESLCRLLTTFDGVPPSYTWLHSESRVELFFNGGQEGGAELSSEVVAALVMTADSTESLSSEVSADLVVTVSSDLGYIAAPPAFALAVEDEYPSKALVRAAVRYGSDGTIKTRENTDAYVLHSHWWAPALDGKGAGHWVRATVTLGDGGELHASAVGSWLDLSTAREWVLVAAAESTTDYYVELTIEVASDPDGTTIVSSCSGSLQATYL